MSGKLLRNPKALRLAALLIIAAVPLIASKGMVPLCGGSGGGGGGGGTPCHDETANICLDYEINWTNCTPPCEGASEGGIFTTGCTYTDPNTGHTKGESGGGSWGSEDCYGPLPSNTTITFTIRFQPVWTCPNGSKIVGNAVTITKTYSEPCNVVKSIYTIEFPGC